MGYPRPQLRNSFGSSFRSWLKPESHDSSTINWLSTPTFWSPLTTHHSFVRFSSSNQFTQTHSIGNLTLCLMAYVITLLAEATAPVNTSISLRNVRHLSSCTSSWYSIPENRNVNPCGVGSSYGELRLPNDKTWIPTAQAPVGGRHLELPRDLNMLSQHRDKEEP